MISRFEGAKGRSVLVETLRGQTVPKRKIRFGGALEGQIHLFGVCIQ
jgi:hypothetical protein